MTRNLENVLVNITPDEKYQIIARSILSSALERINVPDEKKETLAQEPAALIIAGDTFFSMYLPLILLRERENIQTPVLREFRDRLEEWFATTEYRVIKRLTEFDSETSYVFSIRFAATFLGLLAKDLDEEELKQALSAPVLSQGASTGALTGTGRTGSCPGKGRCEKKIGNSVGGGPSHLQGKMAKAVARAFAQAVKEAAEAAERYKVLAPVAGGRSQGLSPGELAFLDKEPGIHRAELDKIVRILASIRKSMPLLFRKAKKTGPLGFPEGYTITNRVDRALARELALPDELFYVKLAGNGFLAKEKKTSSGVMIVLMDKSGSMDENGKTAWAKAVALALALKARREGLEWYLIPFDSRTYNTMEIGDLKDILKIKPDGGTNIGLTLVKALGLAVEKRYDRANIVVITDGIDDIVAKYVEKILDLAKKAKATIKVFYIQGSNDALARLARATHGDLYTVAATERDALKVVRVS